MESYCCCRSLSRGSSYYFGSRRGAICACAGYKWRKPTWPHGGRSALDHWHSLLLLTTDPEPVCLHHISCCADGICVSFSLHALKPHTLWFSVHPSAQFYHVTHANLFCSLCVCWVLYLCFTTFPVTNKCVSSFVMICVKYAGLLVSWETIIWKLTNISGYESVWLVKTDSDHW